MGEPSLLRIAKITGPEKSQNQPCFGYQNTSEKVGLEYFEKD
jgi:hypothetical protein